MRNDPKDPTTWDAEMIAAFNKAAPGLRLVRVPDDRIEQQVAELARQVDAAFLNIDTRLDELKMLIQRRTGGRE